MHKLNWIGNSGIIFPYCDEVSSSSLYIRVTEDDSKVTCYKCLEIMKKIKQTRDREQNPPGKGESQ